MQRLGYNVVAGAVGKAAHLAACGCWTPWWMNLTRRGHVTYVEAEANTQAVIRERGLERRRTPRFVVRDRRSGFERRRSRSRTTPGAAYESSLVYLRDPPRR